MIQEIHQFQFEHALFALLVVLCIALVDVSAAASALFVKPLSSARELVTAVLRRPVAGYTGLAGLFVISYVGVCWVFVFKTHADERGGDP
ncbi:hypothetical protein [Haloarcula sp. CBA1127]|uniref:hypothetical protein n=1 Tax=Haloarcula sp. CBA1127 TaxID=1765055 RepID=UPI00073F02BF|nr:hypothetical protein [Haloarcula sp. CBA1127]